jgi:thymidylate synthase ThyX
MRLRTSPNGRKTIPALLMDKAAAIKQIRDVCNNVSRELMRIHPAVPALEEKEAQDEIFKTLFELTKQVEIIKKRLAKLEAKDESTLL